jgi:hypothetical protein
MKEDKLGEACSTKTRDEKLMWNSVEKIKRERTSR